MRHLFALSLFCRLCGPRRRLCRGYQRQLPGGPHLPRSITGPCFANAEVNLTGKRRP